LTEIVLLTLPAPAISVAFASTVSFPLENRRDLQCDHAVVSNDLYIVRIGALRMLALIVTIRFCSFLLVGQVSQLVLDPSHNRIVSVIFHRGDLASVSWSAKVLCL